MIISDFYHIPTLISLAVVAAILLIAIAVSVVRSRAASEQKVVRLEPANPS